MSTMRAMVLPRTMTVTEGSKPLEPRDLPVPRPGPGEVLIRVSACGVCHTELDEIEGRTAPPEFPVVPGHEVVGRVEETGDEVTTHRVGDRVGVGWIYDSCGRCSYCKSGRENLCSEFTATGRDANGGYAEYMTAPEASAYPIPEVFGDAEAAPLLCAGGVGYRSLARTGLTDGQTLGFFGLGASAHLVVQMARYEYPNARLFVFTRSAEKQGFARHLGADWAAAPGTEPPAPLDAIIDTTPVWQPIEQGLRMLAPGGRMVINAIRKEDADKSALLGLDYGRHLWMEKELTTVANVTRGDIRRALEVAARIPIRPTVETYALEDANQALGELKAGHGRGAKVLAIA
jgi:propanol-preferring alcohol dehydrogenase